MAAGDFGASRQTRSPRAHPASLRSRASRLLARSSASYVRRSSLKTTAPASGRRLACSVTQCCSNALS